jgi:uridine kinase
MPPPILIAVAGGPASGKKEICERIIQSLNSKLHFNCIHLSMEQFYFPLGPEQVLRAQNDTYNFDHPDAFDFQLFREALTQISQSKVVSLPAYDMQTYSRIENHTTISSPDVLLVSGVLGLYDPQIRDLFDLKVFVDIDADTRLARIVIRDTTGERYCKNLDAVLYNYLEHVKVCYEQFVEPTKKYADVVIPRGDDNIVATELLFEHIKDVLNDQSRHE